MNRTTALTALLTALVAASLTACASQATPQPAVTVTVTASPEPAPVEVAPEPATTDPATAVAPTPAPEPVLFTMPDLHGQNLQFAQDTLQALGSWAMDQSDATGLERFQVNDSNWQVCSQDPAPGAVVPAETVVTLAAVKLTETCP